MSKWALLDAASGGSTKVADGVDADSVAGILFLRKRTHRCCRPFPKGGNRSQFGNPRGFLVLLEVAVPADIAGSIVGIGLESRSATLSLYVHDLQPLMRLCQFGTQPDYRVSV